MQCHVSQLNMYITYCYGLNEANESLHISTFFIAFLTNVLYLNGIVAATTGLVLLQFVWFHFIMFWLSVLAF